jgi:hypothetical protein
MTCQVIAGHVPRTYNRGLTWRPVMKWFVPVVLLLVALIHALPLLGVAGGPRLQQLYGLGPLDPNLALLLRHRAVLFGLLAAFLAWAAFRPELHRLALLAGLVSVLSFLLLAAPLQGLTPAIATVVRVDGVALVLLGLGLFIHAFGPTPTISASSLHPPKP